MPGKRRKANAVTVVLVRCVQFSRSPFELHRQQKIRLNRSRILSSY